MRMVMHYSRSQAVHRIQKQSGLLELQRGHWYQLLRLRRARVEQECDEGVGQIPVMDPYWKGGQKLMLLEARSR